MGQFLSIALVEASLPKVKQAILDFSKGKQGDYKTIFENSIQENNILYSSIKATGKSQTIVRYPDYSADFYECSVSISSKLNTRVLTAHVHDDDVWMVYLFDKGKELTRFLSDPELIDEKEENWRCDLNLFSKLYGVSPTELSEFLLSNKDHSSLADSIHNLFDFLTQLGYPTAEIQNYEDGYKGILKPKDLNKITKTFLTIEDLRATKRYSPNPILLNSEEINELYGDEIELVKSHEKCLVCNRTTINNAYLLNVDELCLQIKGDCPQGHEQPHLLLNYGFIHKMEEIHKFLNK